MLRYVTICIYHSLCYSDNHYSDPCNMRPRVKWLSNPKRGRGSKKLCVMTSQKTINLAEICIVIFRSSSCVFVIVNPSATFSILRRNKVGHLQKQNHWIVINQFLTHHLCNRWDVCMNGTTCAPKSVLGFEVDKMKLYRWGSLVTLIAY